MKNKIENILNCSFSEEKSRDIFHLHKVKLINNVLMVYVVMQLFSVVFSIFFTECTLVGFYIYALLINTILLLWLRKTGNVNYVSVVFILANWLPTPVFIYLYGDPYMTNNLWIIALSLLALFTLGRKWRYLAVLYALLNLFYSLYIVIQKKGVSIQNYTVTDYCSAAIDTIFILVIIYMVVLQYIKFNEAVNTSIRKKNKELEKQNIIIENQNRIKTNLLKEVHHRVKNNLQMVNSMVHMQYRGNVDESVKHTLKKVERRILTMAKLHEKIYQSDSFEIVNMKGYIKELLYDLLHINEDIELTYTIDVDKKLRFSNEVSLYIGLLITELVINVLKHAFDSDKGHLTISLKKVTTNNYELKVADNGKGFDYEESKLKSKGLGQQLINSFTRQINGELQISSSSLGTEYTVFFSDY